MNSRSEFELTQLNEELTSGQKLNPSIYYDAKSIFWGNIEYSANRSYLFKRNKKRIENDLYYNLAVGAGYLLFPFLILQLAPEKNEWTEFYYMLGLCYMGYHFFRYQIFLNEVTLEERKGRDWFGWALGRIFGIFGYITSVLFRLLPKNTIVYPLIASTLFITYCAAFIVNSWQIGLGILLASILHLLLQINLYNQAKKLRNYKLLILRVFDMKSSTKFTFNEIWKYWRYIGSYLTVIDKTFLGLKKSKIWTNIISIAIFAFIVESVLLLLIDFLFDINSNEVGYLGFKLIAPAGLFVYYFYNYRKVKDGFIGNEPDIEALLDKIEKRPINYFSRFRGFPVSCYENTWNYVVSKFVQIADVILMDLRGYNESRKGCKQEVRHLLNNFSVSRISFLVLESDLENVAQLLDEEIKNLSITSPNYTEDEIVITMYIANGVQKEQYLDAAGVVSVLINSLPIQLNKAEEMNYITS